MKASDQAHVVNSARADDGKDRVSVCIPSYNSARYIGETIRSVLASTHSNLEVIVSDDASTDNTSAIVQAFDDERVRFFRNGRRLGVPCNWNCAIEQASGEYVGLLNHDDLYGPFWLSYVVHVLKKYPHVGWMATAFRVIDDTGRTLDTGSYFADTREYSRSEAFLCVAKLNGLGPGFIARRQILEQVSPGGVLHPYDEEGGAAADNDLFLRLAARFPLYYSNNPLHAAWRLHSNNLTHRWKPFDQLAECLKTLNKAFSDDALPEELRGYKEFCYLYYYRKVLAQAGRLLKEGDLQTAQRLLSFLCTDGYWGD